MSLKEIMHKPIFVDKDMTIKEVAKIMANKSPGAVLVGNVENVLGIFFERDLLVKVVAKDINLNNARVKDYMNAQVKTIDINASVFEAQHAMMENHIRRLPITDNGKVVGVVSAKNLLEHLKYEYVRKSQASDSSKRDMYSAFW